jgi:hypothetical protein
MLAPRLPIPDSLLASSRPSAVARRSRRRLSRHKQRDGGNPSGWCAIHQARDKRDAAGCFPSAPAQRSEFL